MMEMETGDRISEATFGRTILVADLKSVMANSGVPKEKIAALTAIRLTLWARLNRRCYLLGATHEHETYVVDEAGNRFAVDHLVLHQEIGGLRKDRDGHNTSQVASTETEINLGCQSSGCAGTATHWGVTWSTDWVRV
jgi:hypothetical protein